MFREDQDIQGRCTMNLATLEHRIPGTATALVLVIVGASFALSYTALVKLALDAGIPVFLAPLWPLCLDAFMAVASLVVVRRALDNESTLLAWFVVGGLTIRSKVFNVINAPANLVSQAVYAIPPIVVFISFEMLMSLVKMDIGKTHPIISQAENKIVIKSQCDPDPKVSEIVPGTDTKGDIDLEIARPLLAYYRDHPGGSFTEAAATIKKSRQTASRWVDKLVKAGLLTMDESGTVRVQEGANL
jgi:hypothetical protein